MRIEWQSKNGKWVIYRMELGGLYVVDEHVIFSDRPIKYRDGRIVYNTPERIPAYVKAQVARRIV